MGQRSNTETIVAILKAFLDQRTWSQAELARRVGVAPAVIRKRLAELSETGIPLFREEDHPHVYWSVPKSWYPGGVLLASAQVTELLRQLARLPKSAARNRLIETLLAYLPERSVAAAVVPPETTAREEQHLSTIEDSASGKTTLQFRYFTAGRGSESFRHASVHCVVPGPPARFVATCHRSATLKWFRVENVSGAKLEPAEPYRDADPKQVDAFLSESLDGFHDGGPAGKHAFFVSDPDARWVARNLFDEMHCEEVTGGIQVSVQTSALKRLARFVVGLGGAAQALTPALQAEVVNLARGALTSSQTFDVSDFDALAVRTRKSP